MFKKNRETTNLGFTTLSCQTTSKKRPNHQIRSFNLLLILFTRLFRQVNLSCIQLTITIVLNINRVTD